LDQGSSPLSFLWWLVERRTGGERHGVLRDLQPEHPQFHRQPQLFERALSVQEGLRPRNRDLYEALALPFYGNAKLCACLLECFEYQQSVNSEPLPPKQVGVLEGMFKRIHVQPDRESYALGQLKHEANLHLAVLGERFRLNERVVSEVLKTFGFVDRKRTNAGWVVLVDSTARKRLHELLWVYGAELSACLPTEPPTEACAFCKIQETGESEQPNDTKRTLFEKRSWAFTEEEEKKEEEEQRLQFFSDARAGLERDVLDMTSLELEGNSEGNGTGGAPTSPPQTRGESCESSDNPKREQEEPISAQQTAAETPAETGRTPEFGSDGGEHSEHRERENGAKANSGSPSVNIDDLTDEQIDEIIGIRTVDRDRQTEPSSKRSRVYSEENEILEKPTVDPDRQPVPLSKRINLHSEEKENESEKKDTDLRKPGDSSVSS
jgi:hypothetical protein